VIPEGFTLQGIGGGFTAWSLHHRPLTFRIINHGTGSAPDTLEASALVEVYHDTLSDSHAPALAVQQIRRRLDRYGGDNEESGALSWHFDTAAQAVAWVTEVLDERTFSILRTAALSVDGLTDPMKASLREHFDDRATMFQAWHGVWDVVTNLCDIHTSTDDDEVTDLMGLWLAWGTPDTVPPLPVVKAMIEALDAVADSTPTTGHAKPRR